MRTLSLWPRFVFALQQTKEQDSLQMRHIGRVRAGAGQAQFLMKSTKKSAFTALKLAQLNKIRIIIAIIATFSKSANWFCMVTLVIVIDLPFY